MSLPKKLAKSALANCAAHIAEYGR